MSTNLSDIREQLKESQKSLLKLQNVVATGIGYKKVAGKTTSDLSIICSVEIKKPKDKLDALQEVPKTIDGIPTDVQPVGILRAFQAPTDRYRPAYGGVSVGHYHITAGTLGCLVTKNNETYILSNNHVLANSNEASIGDAVLQPGPYDGGQNPADLIAELSEFIPIVFTGEAGGSDSTCRIAGSVAGFFNALAKIGGSSTRLRPYRIQQQPENKVDCAIAKVLNVNDVINEISGYGKISGVQSGELEMAVKKSGRTTALTSGIIQQIDVTAQVSYGANKIAVFTDQLLAGAMSQGGDSGSAVLSDNNKIVGLLFAGSTTTTIINRIENVFSALGVSLLD